MQKPGKQQALQAAACLLCVLLELKITDGLEGTEFSGGWLTGPLLSMADVGMLLFILAFAITWVYPRVAAVLGVASLLLCLPLYLFFLNPVAFNHFLGFGHDFKVQPTLGFHWGRWTLTGIGMVLVTGFICVRRLTVRSATVH